MSLNYVPICGVCKKKMKYVKSGANHLAFWSCPDKKKGPDGQSNEHETISITGWNKKIAALRGVQY